MENKDDDFIFTSGDVTITVDNNYNYTYAAQDTVTITNMAGGIETITLPPLTVGTGHEYVLSSGTTINLDNISSTFTFDNIEWKNSFPDFHTVEKMCEEYPGLAKAFENFKTVYKMVEQDWKGKMKDDQANLF
jgi:hypothetical protein